MEPIIFLIVDTLKHTFSIIKLHLPLNKWNQSTTASETPRPVLLTILKDFFNPKHFNLTKMVSTLQQSLKGFSIIDDAGIIFTNFITTVQNCLEPLIRLFNNILSPETRDQMIHHWLPMARKLLIAATVLILLIWCIIRMFSVFIFVIRSLLGCISFIAQCLMKFLGLGGKPMVKMMVAPGLAPLKIPRAVFEASPKIYFATVRLISIAIKPFKAIYKFIKLFI